MSTDKLNVFVSYSHKDKAWLERVQVHLRPLAREGKLDLWDDTRIKTGQRWHDEIKAALAKADVAVLLISADFYASDFIAKDELSPLLEAARSERGLVIVGLHINYSRFDRDEVLSEYQTVNTPDKPTEDLSRAQQEKVFDDLARRIEELPGPNPSRDSAPAGLVPQLPTEERPAIIAEPVAGGPRGIGHGGGRATGPSGDPHLNHQMHRTLLAALRTRAEQSGQVAFGAEDVRAVGAAIGLADTEVVSVLEALADQGLARIQWCGEVRLLEGQGKTGGRSDEGTRPSVSWIFNAPVIYSTGEGARIDTRGSGRGAAYKPDAGEPEAAFGKLGAAVVELRMRMSELEGEAASKVQALEAVAREVAEQGARAKPDRRALGERLQSLAGRLEDVAKLQAAVTKLEPTLTIIKNAAGVIKTWLLGS